MSEKSINDIFENQSPSSLLSPFKRTNSQQFHHNLKKQVCDRYQKIVVQDTPSPFMIQKTKSKTAETDTEKEKKTFESSIKITRRIIPNTPVVVKNNLNISSNKKIKKLFDNNLRLVEDLPGNEDRIKLIEDGKKVSSLFKPRSIADKTENQFPQNDISYEEKKPRRRNPLVARLSDIEPLNLIKNDDPEQHNQEEISSSPIIAIKKTNLINTIGEKAIQSNEPYFEDPVYLESKLTTFNYTHSFTHVSEINCQNQNANEDVVKSLFDSDSYTQAVDENKIDQILFDGLKITDFNDKKSNSKLNDKKVGLFDKTNTSNIQKSKYARKKSVFTHKTNKLKQKPLDLDVVFPKKNKTLNIAHLDLNENQKEKLRQIVDYINCEQSNRTKSANAVFQNRLHSNTSHLVIDFEAILCNNKLETIQKLTLILALIKKCHIMRFEWLAHSELKREWCPEDQYTLESYIDIDLDNFEEQNEFDIRLVKFERNLKLTDRVDLFSKYGNIFLLGCDFENFNDISLSDSFFKSKNCLYDYFHELITRCNGLITSRAACANLIILIDTSDDYETSTKLGADQVLQEAIKFKKIFKEIRGKLIKCKIKKKINIISSNWILESVLDNHLKNQDDYVICCYEGYD